MTPEERADVLARVLAEGFLYLAEHGMLESDDQASEVVPVERIKKSMESPGQVLISRRKEGSPSFNADIPEGV
ncbi:MAG: hypothetical protein HY549_09610 [Elusimicrobia bacterium]|nr:hypothetical protein [Elusimicrobiota bacterium]